MYETNTDILLEYLFKNIVYVLNSSDIGWPGDNNYVLRFLKSLIYDNIGDK